MRSAACFFASLATASLVSCGGGSDGSESVATEFLPFTLVSTGVVFAATPPAISQVVIVSSAEQLTQLSTGRFTIPAALASFDFAQGDIVYVEGAGDTDPTSVARISQVSRTSNVEFVTAEICSTVARVPGTHRPYALYTTQNIPNVNATTISLAFFDCPSVRRLQSTVVASGLGNAFVDPPPRFIRDPAAYEQVAQFIGLSAPPPDFSQSMLVMVTTLSDGLSTLRFMGAYQNADGSRDFVSEFCGYLGRPNARPYLLVMIPASSVDPRIATAFANPPDCVTPTP